MSDTASENVKLCREWYSVFDKRDLEGLMKLFTRDPTVMVGAGASCSAVDYAGTYSGEEEVRRFYEERFSEKQDGRAPVRPYCAFRPQPCEFGCWVVFSGEVRDHLRGGAKIYDGSFLHVWRIDLERKKIASLDMFLEPSGRISPRD